MQIGKNPKQKYYIKIETDHQLLLDTCEEEKDLGQYWKECMN